jgi:hypothetical protein
MTRVLTHGSVTVSCWLMAATVVACGGKALDVGHDSLNADATTSGGSSALAGMSPSGACPGPDLDPVLASLQWPATEGCEPAPDSPLVGTWKGRWPGTSNDAVLTIKGLTPSGVPCGTFRIGEGEPLAPPTDPEAIYPASGTSGSAGTSGAEDVTFMELLDHPVRSPWPGQEYELLTVVSEGTRLEFKVSFSEILRPWCQMQQAFAGACSCLPQWSTVDVDASDGNMCHIIGPDTRRLEVPCWKIPYCSIRTCLCYDGHCDAALNTGASLELHWDGLALEGTVNGGTNVIFLDPVTP